MKYKKGLGETVFDVSNNIFMVVFLLICLYPIWFVLVSSFSNASLFTKHIGFLFLPLGIDLKAYSIVFKNEMILTGYLNTTFIVVVGTLLNVFMTAIAAYFLSRRDVYWKKLITMMILFTMFFSGGLIPLYIVVMKLGLRNSLWSLLLPSLVSSYNIIVMRTYFMGIPREMEESAVIDGANDIKILFRLILPISMPVVAVMILWYGVGHWNAWFYASIFLNKSELFPLQLVMRRILILDANLGGSVGMAYEGSDILVISSTIKYAVIIVCTIPIVCIYPFLQKYFVKGVMIGAVKG